MNLTVPAGDEGDDARPAGTRFQLKEGTRWISHE